MIVDACALQTFGRGKETFLCQGLTAELLVVRGPRRPCATPIIV